MSEVKQPLLLSRALFSIAFWFRLAGAAAGRAAVAGAGDAAAPQHPGGGVRAGGRIDRAGAIHGHRGHLDGSRLPVGRAGGDAAGGRPASGSPFSSVNGHRPTRRTW
eukprot:7160834-Pyramimonas_sp.AAC.1